jgi:TonB family protein
MKTKISILLIGIIFACFSGFAKKIDFYIPPISKVRIDPADWDLPYTKPYAFIAPMFKAGVNKIVIKNKTERVTYTFTCMYLPDDSLQAKYRYIDGKRKAKLQPPIGNFEVYESTYYESKDKITYFIDKSTPNFVLIVSVDFPISNKEKLEGVKKFLSKFEKVDPTEIDKAVGYPLDKSILVDTLKKGRITIDRKYNSNSYYYDTGKDRERKLVMDYTTGFTYKEFFQARVRLERNNYTDDEKARYAFHLSEGLKGLVLLDSMSDVVYSSARNDKKFMEEYLKRNLKDSSFDFRYAAEIKTAENGYWWFLSNGAEFSIAFVTTGLNGKLKFEHHLGETSFWERKEYFIERRSIFLNDQGSENYKAIELIGPDSSIIKYQTTILEPNPTGMEYKGIRTFYLDSKNPNAEMVKFESIPFQNEFKLVYADLGTWKKINLYADRDWNFNSAKFDYSIYQKYPKLGWSKYYKNTYFEDYETQLASFERLQNISQDSTLIIYRVETISVNGKNKLVRPYISNGKLLSCDVLDFGPEGLSKGAFDPALETELMKSESYKTILAQSKWKYSEFNGEVSPRTEIVELSDSELRENYNTQIPDVLVLQGPSGKTTFNLSDAEVKTIVSSIKYPEKAKMKQIGGVVTLDVVVEPNGNVVSAKAVNTIPGAPDLSLEAERLIKTFGKFSKGVKTPDGNTTIQVSIRFVP